MAEIKRASDRIHQTLLGWTPEEPSPSQQRKIRAKLEPFDLQDAKDGNTPVDLPLPDWMGTYSEMVQEAVDHVGHSGERLADLKRFVDLEVPELPSGNLPSLPGWYRYSHEGDYTNPGWHCVKGLPSGNVLVLDFETVNISGFWYPFCMAALTSEGWYLWLADLTLYPCDPWIETLKVTDPKTGKVKKADLERTYGPRLATTIAGPIGATIIGHNIQYDRQYLTEEYLIDDSQNRFVDTMGAWIATRGMGNQQRVTYRATAGEYATEDSNAPMWTEDTGTNGLADVYNFYTGETLDKGVRDAIEAKGLIYITENLPEVAWYCIKDVWATFKVARSLLPELMVAQPNPVSLLGQLELGSSWLPLSSERYPGYYDRAESAYSLTAGEVARGLLEIALEVASQGDPSTNYQLVEDQLLQLDWTLGRLELKPEILETLGDLDYSGLEKVTTKTGKNYLKAPLWFRDFVKNPSLHSRLVPSFLQAQYLGTPVIWIDDQGWTANGGMLPHPEKRGKPVTDLFVKGYVSLWEAGTLTSPLGSTKDLLTKVVSTINWVSLRKRVACIHSENLEGFPVTLPQLVVTGTVTRRAADKLWQVAANPKAKRIGTELKSMVEAPPGWSFVGADVDSQELWIASAYADTDIGICGSSPLGVMTLIGDKATRTDPHSVVAIKTGIDRDTGKVLNYAGIYGQGLSGTVNLLMKSLPDKSEADCTKLGNDFLSTFKGNKSPHTRRWIGGLASDAFNYMERIANDRSPRTPFLKARMSLALAGVKDFATTRVNWTIQSSGVDFRDLLLVLVSYYFHKLSVEARLLMTIHDEIRYMVRAGQETLATYGLQLAHLTIRALFIDTLGLDCIPAGIAWFSAVDVDQVLRKDPYATQVTPSQPVAIAPGRCISPTDLLGILTGSQS